MLGRSVVCLHLTADGKQAAVPGKRAQQHLGLWLVPLSNSSDNQALFALFKDDLT